MGSDGQDVLIDHRAWAYWVRSLPTFTFQIMTPKLQELRVQVTPRSLRLSGRLFALRGAKDLYFAGVDVESTEDVLVDASVGQSRWFGPYLEVVARRERLGASRLIRRRRLDLRLYMADPEPVFEAATQAALQRAT